MLLSRLRITKDSVLYKEEKKGAVRERWVHPRVDQRDSSLSFLHIGSQIFSKEMNLLEHGRRGAGSSVPNPRRKNKHEYRPIEA
jgi:hypothetical protein